MTIDDAIREALRYERKVLAVYQEAADECGDSVGKAVFEGLGAEERGHVEYLEAKLAEWEKDGTVTPGDVATGVPAEEDVAEALAKTLRDNPTQGAQDTELEFLKRALEAETETSAFYERMVDELPPEGKALFEPFLKIENGHRSLVQAEIDALTGTGFWFDMAEFRFEAG